MDSLLTQEALELKIGIVRRFTQFSLPDFTKCKADLGLAMTAGELAYCAKIYGLTGLQDISTDLLHFYDAVLTARRRDPASLTVTELLTDDRVIAETYADLIRKYNAVRRPIDGSLTLQKMVQTGADYARSLGKEPSGSLSFGDEALPWEVAPRTIWENAVSGVSLTAASAHYTDIALDAKAKDSLFALLVPFDATNLGTLRESLKKLFAEQSARRLLKRYAAVGEGDFLSQILAFSEEKGISLDMAPLERIGLHKPADLPNGAAGLPLLLIDRKNEQSLREVAASCGLYTLVFAETVKGLDLAIRYGQEPLLTIRKKHLEALALSHPLRLLIAEKAEAVLPTLGLSDDGTLDGACSGTVVSLPDGRLGCTVSFSATAGYSAALSSVCSLLSVLASHGVPYEKVSLSIVGSLPRMTDKATAGEVAATLLGLYRSEAEFALPAERIVLSVEDKPAVLTVFAAGIPNREETKEPLSVFPADADGCPVFSSFRAALRALSGEG